MVSQRVNAKLTVYYEVDSSLGGAPCSSCICEIHKYKGNAVGILLAHCVSSAAFLARQCWREFITGWPGAGLRGQLTMTG